MTMESVRYLRKNFNQNERDNVSNWWYEYINQRGTLCEYYVNSMSLSSMDLIYGEQPTHVFTPSSDIIMLTDINNDTSLLLSKFGIQCDSDLTCVIHISGFRETFGKMDSTISPYFSGSWREPVAGDVIRLAEYGWDRPGAKSGASWAYPPSAIKTENDHFIQGAHPAWEAWARNGGLYEVTQRVDEDISKSANLLLGHYIWIIKCKRYDYSFEKNIEPELGSSQPSDPTFYGKLSGGSEPVTPKKIYPDNIEDESNKLFNYDDPGDGKKRDDNVYGGYGRPGS